MRVCSIEKTVLLSNGLKIDADLLPKRPRPDRSIWFVPGLGIEDSATVMNRFSQPDAVQAIAALQTQARAGGTIAAACSAVFLLREAGLLAGKRVTTNWWLGGLLRQVEPQCVVDVDQMVVADGNIVTGGAAFAHIDLMLHLLRTRFNPSLAEAVSRATALWRLMRKVTQATPRQFRPVVFEDRPGATGARRIADRDVESKWIVISNPLG